MPRQPNSHPSYDRLLKEVRNSMRVCHAILDTPLPQDKDILARGLLAQLTRWIPPELPPKRRR